MALSANIQRFVGFFLGVVTKIVGKFLEKQKEFFTGCHSFFDWPIKEADSCLSKEIKKQFSILQSRKAPCLQAGLDAKNQTGLSCRQENLR
jgi:hypothetical protein